ncbi:hypothetical protein FB45DRAFT_1060954 [Roridomyces roridus]|uniref:Uncharacterized protein n=1 Tax=Roridomyces roridus TaxID=1738132 RepID=A0AAD7FHT3_9AGAR|nr:hypothetical protein FB45DRAFT_1060954 [Roridomyces roridus]
MLARPLSFRIRTPAAIRHSSSAIERLKNWDRGGQNLSQRYRRLEQSLRGKEALQRDKRELEVSISDSSAPTTSAAREGGYYFRGIEVPQRPRAPESDECCMSGCAVCVYDLYEESLTAYRTAADAFRSKLVVAGVPSAEWPDGFRSSTDVGISVPLHTRGATLSAFEALEKALEEKKRASRPSEQGRTGKLEDLYEEVSLDPRIQRAVTCQLSTRESTVEAVLRSGSRRCMLNPQLTVHPGAILTVQCTHHKPTSNLTTPSIAVREFAYQDIVRDICVDGTSIAGDSDLAMHIDIGDAPETLSFIFKILKVHERYPAMARVNEALRGRGFHYLSVQRVDGSSEFERRLASTPYPQTIPFTFSLSPDMPDLRLCLLRRPYYIWPLKSMVKSSSLTWAEALKLVSAAPLEGVEHTFPDVPEISIHLVRRKLEQVLEQGKEAISRRTRLLDRLGPYRALFENIARVAGSAAEYHPIAKSIWEGLKEIYSTLSELEEWDEKLLEVLEDMTRFLRYVNEFKCFTNFQNYENNIKTLEPEIIRVGNLLSKYYKHGISFQMEMAEYKQIRRRFQRWTAEFQERVMLETLKLTQTLPDMMKTQNAFFHKERNDILNGLRPQGTDRQRPLPGCLKGTREDVLEKLHSFLAKEDAPNIIWVKGFPGSGKSCISRTLVEHLTGTPTFGSSFFFERGGGVFASPSAMVRTLAADLVRRHEFKEAVTEIVQTRGMDYNTTAVVEQFRQLVQEPLRASLAQESALVVVLDALDECGGLDKRCVQDRDDVLEVIKLWATLEPTRRLVVTSRDEASIAAVLGPISESLELRLSSQEVTRDIEAFLKREFQRIAHSYCIPTPWPTEEEIASLAKKAHGLFVWAATLVKFIDQPGPQDALEQILSGDTMVHGDITKLYRAILKISFYPDGDKRRLSKKFMAEFHTFIGAIVTAIRPLERASPLFEILGVDAQQSNFICSRLRSVLTEDKYHELRFDHQSFNEFLVESDDCQSCFRINPSNSRREIARALFTTLQGLEFDPYKFPSSYKSNPKVERIRSKYISPRLRYASQFWADSLSEDLSGDAQILASLKTFFETKFLFWLEVLSLTDQMSGALDQLRRAAKWLGALVKDAIVFVESFQECMGKSAPHIYLSAMTFVPENSKIRQLYSPLINPCATVILQGADEFREGRAEIPATNVHIPDVEDLMYSQAFEGHAGRILCVEFVHGEYVASAGSDGSIRFWDPLSGVPVLKPFETHAGPVTCLAYARDANLLVAGSRDTRASVWDLDKLELVAELRHESPVTRVAILPSGAVVATLCKDNIVRFWHVATQKKCRESFRGHSGCVTGIAFLSEDILLSSSEDRTIYSHWVSLDNSEVFLTCKFAIYSFALDTSAGVLAAACYSCIAIWNLSPEDTPLETSVHYLAQGSHELDLVAIHGTLLATANGRNKIQVWDLSSRQRIFASLEGHRDMVTSLAFSPDGRRLISGSMDKTARVWDMGDGIGGGFMEGSRMGSESGWIEGPGRELIIWVPKACRKRLCWGRTLAVIDGKPMVRLSVDLSLMGERWYKGAVVNTEVGVE